MFIAAMEEINIMSVKNKKQFGVWIDSQHAIVVGREAVDSGEFVILAHAKAGGQGGNSNENAANNSEQGSLQKMFKEITSHMQNVEEIHVTGTGTAQEQFIKYMSQSPQFKNAVAKESTSNKMSDEKLLEFVAGQFN
jgi:stalled ribosome rescue protein Dom34